MAGPFTQQLPASDSTPPFHIGKLVVPTHLSSPAQRSLSRQAPVITGRYVQARKGSHRDVFEAAQCLQLDQKRVSIASKTSSSSNSRSGYGSSDGRFSSVSSRNTSISQTSLSDTGRRTSNVSAARAMVPMSIRTILTFTVTEQLQGIFSQGRAIIGFKVGYRDYYVPVREPVKPRRGLLKRGTARAVAQLKRVPEAPPYDHGHALGDGSMTLTIDGTDLAVQEYYYVSRK